MSASTKADLSPWKRLAQLPAGEREEFIARYAEKAGLDPDLFLTRISRDWAWTGRPKQQAPPGSWMYWAIRAGRGFGKTLSAGQWIKRKADTHRGSVDDEGIRCRIGLIAPTLADVRGTMVEGETGLLSILPNAALRGDSRESAWNRGTCELYLKDGTFLKGFSSEVPNRLRGPQHHYVWGEEYSSWEDAKLGDAIDTTFSNMKLGLRLGELPQAVLTSTPKANKLTRDVLALPSLVVSVGSSYENRDNLSEAWWETVVAPLEGTRTGRQEIHAEILDDVEGALWRSAQLDERRIDVAPALSRVVVAVDPNASSSEAANDAGIVVMGRDSLPGLSRRGFVLADRTVTRGGPHAWAAAAVDAYYEYDADRIVAEKNNGGEMVKITIHTVDPTVPVKLVSASKGKRTRAEPVSALYETTERHPLGRVFHVGPPGEFVELEGQMTTWTPDAESPDRLDALVWGGTELLLGPTGQMTVHAPKGRVPVAGR